MTVHVVASTTLYWHTADNSEEVPVWDLDQAGTLACTWSQLTNVDNSPIHVSPVNGDIGTNFYVVTTKDGLCG